MWLIGAGITTAALFDVTKIDHIWWSLYCMSMMINGHSHLFPSLPGSLWHHSYIFPTLPGSLWHQLYIPYFTMLIVTSQFYFPYFTRLIVTSQLYFPYFTRLIVTSQLYFPYFTRLIVTSQLYVLPSLDSQDSRFCSVTVLMKPKKVSDILFSLHLMSL